MTRRRAVEVEADVAWSSHAQGQLHLAAWHGCRGEHEFFPPEAGDRQPTREWCEAFYEAHRDRLVDHYVDNGGFLAVWPVATFEPPGLLRDEAVAVWEAHQLRDEWDRENLRTALEHPEILNDRNRPPDPRVLPRGGK